MSYLISFHLRSHEDLREELLNRLKTYYNQPGGEFFSPALDFVQTMFKCCGIVNEDDYDESMWKKDALGGADLIYPLTCCTLKNESSAESYLNPMPRDKGKCMSSDIRLYGQHRHPNGCLDNILDWSTLEFVIVIAICMGCAIIEMMSICISVYLVKHLRRRNKMLMR